jgi:hypothetical protein
VYKNERLFFVTSRAFFLPLLWACWAIPYSTNIPKLFPESWYTIENTRFGIYMFSQPLGNMFLMFFVFFYSSMMLRFQVFADINHQRRMNAESIRRAGSNITELKKESN